MPEETKSVLETLQAGSGWLEKKGVPEARRNMEHLLAHVLGIKRLDLYLQFDRPLGEAELVPLRALLQRRGKREPLQHLLGDVDFLGRIFKSDARALIPRPETEELVEKLLKEFSSSPPARVVDIGCGSGVIGLSLALAWPESEVTLIDLDPDALALAKENAGLLGLDEKRVRFLQGDLLAPVAGEVFERIVANLPYLPASDMKTLDPEVTFDPALALDGGADGLEIIRRLVTALPAALAPGGLAAFEVGLGQGEATAALLATAGLSGARCELDFQGADRFVFGRSPTPVSPTSGA
ncbi:MAG: peptide chain release factor N(5)-glutamine methyltransferase [Verrucomicrobiales bacterium]